MAVGSSTSGQMAGTKNLKTDIALYAIESLPAGISAAHLLLEQTKMRLGAARPILCGHSLGGAIATIVAVETALPCCAFNAPTVSKMVRGGIIHGPYVRVPTEIWRPSRSRSSTSICNGTRSANRRRLSAR